jgi:pyruvate dehydrogenase E2 component (dihydrolipoyllysine-residue acetyltransferase)
LIAAAPSARRLARERKLTANNLSSAEFTLSNLGGIGLSGIFPIVNWPQVAILGIAASQIEPRFIDGEFLPRLMMPLTLGFDHRVINGADGARFLQYLKKLLEDPFSLLL